jgi:hypothetical protein
MREHAAELFAETLPTVPLFVSLTHPHFFLQTKHGEMSCRWWVEHNGYSLFLYKQAPSPKAGRIVVGAPCTLPPIKIYHRQLIITMHLFLAGSKSV